jgi:hypothetical protein
MNALRTTPVLLVAAIVALCLPAAATAAEPVPAGNPAATQYTEAFPTAGGPRDAEGSQKGNGARPNQVLGERNARRLESQGEAGREAAALAAETAPSQSGGSTGSASNGGKGAGGKGAGSGTRAPGDSASNSGGGHSGFDEVLGQATGSSSGGGISPLLPLVILGTIAWALAYLLRQRKSQAE